MGTWYSDEDRWGWKVCPRRGTTNGPPSICEIAAAIPNRHEEYGRLCRPGWPEGVGQHHPLPALVRFPWTFQVLLLLCTHPFPLQVFCDWLLGRTHTELFLHHIHEDWLVPFR